MNLPGHDRQHARFLAEYSDEIVAEHRKLQVEGNDEDDASLRELLQLVDELSIIRTPPPATLHLELLKRFPEQATSSQATTSRESRLADSLRLRLSAVLGHLNVGSRRLHSALSLAVLVLVVAMLSLAKPPSISAAEILSRADKALAGLVGEGEVLHRRQRVTAISVRDGVVSRAEQIVDEWVDGGDNQRLAGRGSLPDGSLLWRYAAVAEAREFRPHLYFTSTYDAVGQDNGSAEVLIVRPTQGELDRALATVPESRRAALARFLSRRYIYEPVVGDQRYNAVLLEQLGDDLAGIPRVRLSLREVEDASGEPMYRVQVSDPARIWHQWGRTGPIVNMASCETLLEITREGLLTRKASVTCQIDDGSTVTSERVLVGLSVLNRARLSPDLFDLNVGPDVPMRRQTAAEELASFSAALDRFDPLNRGSVNK